MDRGAWGHKEADMTERLTPASPAGFSDMCVRNSCREFYFRIWKDHQGSSPVTLALKEIFPLTIKRNTPQDYEG